MVLPSAFCGSRRIRHWVILLAAAFGLLSTCGVVILFSQTPFHLSGFVVDRSGAALPNVHITLIRNGERIASTVSGSEGGFSIAVPSSGRFDIEAVLEGFAKNTLKDVLITPSSATSIRIELNTGSSGSTEYKKGQKKGKKKGIDSGTGFPPPPPPRHTTETFTDPVWNVWSEHYRDEKPKFKSVKMQSGKTYALVVDLSALRYRTQESDTTYSHNVGGSFTEWVHRTNDEQAVLQVLAIPDERFFERQAQDQRVRPLIINLGKLRKAQAEGFDVGRGNPLDFLAKNNGHAAFSFADSKAVFRIQAKRDVVGRAPIALSFWAGGIPVDELSYPACIVKNASDPCAKTDPEHDSLRGVDVADHKAYPDAALQLIELDSTNLVGVFHCNTCGWKPDDFKTWMLGRGADWFREQFTESVLRNIRVGAVGTDPGNEPHYSVKTFENAGDALYGLLFHSEDGNPLEAEIAFRSFVARRIEQEKADTPPPSLFIRVLPQRPDDAFIIPAGLARVQVAPGRNEFLGFHFRIQTPLELQDYSPTATCISRWVLLVPPPTLAGNPLMDARDKFADWIRVFQSSTDTTTLFDDLDKFKDWLNPIDPLARKEGEAILILSHHDKNSLYFDQNVSAILPSMKRRFDTPSIAIIDACGTANPGAFEFVREFNLHGVSSVIASSIEVDARMGGLFLKFLMDSLDLHSSESSYTLDGATFDAIKALSLQSDEYGDTPQRFGPRALIFGLVGNGNLRACPPRRSQ